MKNEHSENNTSGHNKSKCQVQQIDKPETLISKNLKYLMKERGMSIQELSRKTKITRQTIYDILNGSNPKDKSVEALAKALNVTEEELKGGIYIFDLENFLGKVSAKYEPEDHDGLTIEDYLVSEYNLNPIEFLSEHRYPMYSVRKRIADDFGYSPKELFKCVSHISFNSSQIFLNRKEILSLEKIDLESFSGIFEKLTSYNKKIVFNLCLDLYKAQLIPKKTKSQNNEKKQ